MVTDAAAKQTDNQGNRAMRLTPRSMQATAARRRAAAFLFCAITCGAPVAGLGAEPQTWSQLPSGVVRDSDTGLQWTGEDNGRDIDWSDAKAYCGARKGGWRLPTVDELEALYRAAERHGQVAKCGEHLCKVPTLFKLTSSWLWSSTPSGYEKDDGRANYWGVLLVNGARTSALGDFDYRSRVLCVRSS
jgi:formylglycine-generating enzyme required for sulfatase activity